MQQRESQRRHQREGRRLPIYPNPGWDGEPQLPRAMYRSLLADKKHLRFIRRSPKPLRLNKQRNTSTFSFRPGDISRFWPRNVYNPDEYRYVDFVRPVAFAGNCRVRMVCCSSSGRSNSGYVQPPSRNCRKLQELRGLIRLPYLAHLASVWRLWLALRSCRHGLRTSGMVWTPLGMDSPGYGRGAGREMLGTVCTDNI